MYKLLVDYIFLSYILIVFLRNTIINKIIFYYMNIGLYVYYVVYFKSVSTEYKLFHAFSYELSI